MQTSGSYDSPEYAITKSFNLVTIAGADTIQAQKFVAYADLQLKKVQGTVLVAGTNTSTIDQSVIFSIVSANTTNTTYIGSIPFGTSAVNFTTNTTFDEPLMNQGDVLIVTNGIDATIEVALAFEYRTHVGASYTV